MWWGLNDEVPSQCLMSRSTSSYLFKILTYTWGTAVNAKVPIRIVPDFSKIPANSMDAVVFIRIPSSEINDVLYAENICIYSHSISALRKLRCEHQRFL